MSQSAQSRPQHSHCGAHSVFTLFVCLNPLNRGLSIHTCATRKTSNTFAVVSIRSIAASAFTPLRAGIPFHKKREVSIRSIAASAFTQCEDEG